ncbi:hypothetical protein L916_11755 [Phytophthora nicotianae]|uniref:PiggyBac transposable element-derived protein domain-containing protein n=1 Tax=Phytophthora nicotianae TaxID=4792 RepID=W2IS88_PHYNI|nr:hypothetical protein L916_11755 [Phytophthora nicotianae]
MSALMELVCMEARTHALESGILDELEEGADQGTSAVALRKRTAQNKSPAAGTTTAEEQTTSTVEATQPDPFGDPAESFGASQIDTSPGASPLDAAVNLQLLSETSGLESGTERSDEEQKEPHSPVQTLRPRTRVKYDVNFVPEGEDESDYESFSSDKSEGEDLSDNDDEPERGGIENDDDVLSEGDAVDMDEAFIASLMIGENSLRGAAKKQRAASLRATQWTTVSSNYELDVTVYAGMNDEKAQSVAELHTLAHSPLLTFLSFMAKSLRVLINTQTNLYALQQIDRRTQAIQDKQRVEGRHGRVESLKQIRRRLKMKRGYETHVILHVLGLLIARMLCP